MMILSVLYTTSSCARSARFATCARSSLRSLCLCAIVLEARCVHFVFVLIIVCCGVVHRCSHQHIYVLHNDKLVTRYKDASENNRE